MFSLAIERTKRAFHCRWTYPALLSIVLALGPLPAHAAADDVLTQHNDNARTGAQTHETALKPGNISTTTFGRLYERQVDGQIITQPLYAGDLQYSRAREYTTSSSS